ncbi:MAG TPA: HlyD family efflux transporter periplasmic adaptor subunit, partial [Planctomycetota bacterium]|nr:HlyD family efflux transporter periplasmic adaptor subunit [Planctomycetota bacterium]
MRPRTILLGAGALVAAGALAWAWRGGAGEPAEAGGDEAVFTALRGDLVITLTENGELVAKESKQISAGTDSSAKLTFLIEEGTEVPAGEVLARLDPTELERRVQELELDIMQMEANVVAARTEVEIQESENRSTLEKAEAALDHARKDLMRWTEGDGPNERRKREVAIKEAETNASRALKKAEDSVRLFEQDYINKSQVEQDQIDAERAQVQLESSQLELRIFDEYEQPMKLKEKTQAVKDGELAMESATKRAESTLHQKQVKLEQDTKRLELQREQLEKSKEEIAKHTVTAPIPGIVLYGDPTEPWYRENIRLGGDVWGNMILFTIPDLRVMQVRLKIHEADVNKLDEGQKAKITMDTYPGKVLDGEVTRIATIATGTDRWGSDSEVKKFDVEITLAGDSELRLKPGVSAKAEVYVGRREQVVQVPLQAVFQEEGGHWCWVTDGNGPQRVAVVPGASNDHYLEIVSGLEPGQQVLLYNPKLAVPKPGEEPDQEGPPAEPAEDGAAEPEAEPAAEPAARGSAR